MNPLRVRSVRSKLAMIVLAANLCALTIAGGALLYADWYDYEANQIGALSTEASILADAAVPALDFNDPKLASESLALLDADPRVESAALYASNGQIFAQFHRDGAESARTAIPTLAPPEGTQTAGDRILLSRRVATDERILGSLFINARFGRNQRLLTYLQTLGIALVVSILASAAVSVRLRRWITRPIQLVADAAKEVIEKRDFSVQARKTSDDEIGYMVDAFNAMLAEIAARTEAMEASKRSLEAEVHERRAAQQSLQHSELRQRTLVSALSSVVWTADITGCLTGDEHGWELFTGQSAEQWSGLGWRSAFHPEDQGALDRTWAVALSSQAQFELEARLWHAVTGAHRQVIVRGVPLAPRAGFQVEWIGAVIDVEDRRAAEREVLKLNAELEQRVAERTNELEAANQTLAARTRDAEAANQSKAEFLANMSHEIRTPMNAVLGLAYLLTRRPLAEDDLGLVQKIRSAGRSLQAIINDILDFSKIEAGKLEIERAPFLLNDVLDNLSNVMSANAGSKDIELTILPPPKLRGRLIGDALRLEQVLINLTGNAIKFTEIGGVSIAVSVIERDDEHVVLRFSIRDSGIGIAEDKLPQIFSAFAQADSSTTRRFGGTGLGLAISRHLVDKMGGELHAQSKLGQGSEFWFCLSFGQIDESEFAPPDIKGLDLLVADDCEPTRDSLVIIAESVGWRATAVASGASAVHEALSRMGLEKPYDVIVLDWKMPEMDGLEAARRIRQSMPAGACPIVVMASAYSRDELMGSAGEGLVDAFLSKPVTSSSLYNAVVDARRRRGTHTPLTVPREVSAPRLPGVRVLVVDDSDINREVASRILAGDGARVELAENGAEALDWLKAHPNAVDIVLMDVQMPVMDGYQAARRIRLDPQLQSLPVVALTAGAFRSQVEDAKAAGMDDFVAKPFDVEGLMQVICRLTGRTGDARTANPSQVMDNETPPGPSIELRRGLALWRDAPTLRRYLRQFAAQYADAGGRVRDALSQSDLAAAAVLLHKLRGAAGAVALTALYEVASRLEQEVHESKSPPASSAEFETTLNCALGDIAEWQQQFPDEETSAPALEPRAAGSADVRILLDALLAEDSEQVDRSLAALRTQLSPPQFAQLRASVEAFDFGQAAKHANDLLRSLTTPQGDD